MIGDDRDVIDGLVAELDRSDLPVAIVSSELLSNLYFFTTALRRLAALLRAIEYETTIVLYVRDQNALAESTYAEFVKKGFAWDADAFLDVVVERDPFCPSTGWRFCFDYALLADTFVSAFGRERIVVRPYLADATSEVMLRDFWRSAGVPEGDFPIAALPRYNSRASFRSVFETLHGSASKTRPAEPEPETILHDLELVEAADRPFCMLNRADVARIDAAFARANRTLARRYGAQIVAERNSADMPVSSPQREALRAASLPWQLATVF